MDAICTIMHTNNLNFMLCIYVWVTDVVVSISDR